VGVLFIYGKNQQNLTDSFYFFLDERFFLFQGVKKVMFFDTFLFLYYSHFMRVGIYARVSTHDQQTLPMQLEKMREYIENRKWQLTVEVEEIGSGAKTRPKREELLKMAKRREIDVILVWKLDRFGRSMADLVTTLNELRELGVVFVSLTESLDFSTPSGRAMAGMLSTFAEFERDMIRERVKAGIANARAKGKKHGRPKTAALKIKEIIELKSEGLNNSQIARKLKISRASVIELLKGQVIPKPKAKPKTAIVTLWLRVENNSKFVRGKTRVRDNIEKYHLSDHGMKKIANWEYELTFTYKNVKDLQNQIDDLHQELHNEADLRNCFIEADFIEKSTERSF
jgi:DNA invertase Pin-like site-specific DNA recombinase